jgi:alpha-glucosidase
VVHAAGPWWVTASIYQVYPRSFQDTDGDGIGDLPGITSRLDYLAWLGIDVVWISPVFRSPMRDFGYDVSDYRDVDPLFGTLVDLDGLVAEAHRLGLRVVLDFVPNHTSSDHPWFRAARADRQALNRDWYVWRAPAEDGSPPNDMLAQFGGPAWTLDKASGEYWYHSFLPEQPDLDWRNPRVRAAMLDVLRFWFSRGIDGFRIDVLWMIAKDDWPFRDGPVGPGPATGTGDPRNALGHGDGPAIQGYLRELRDVADAHGERLLIGELYLPPKQLARYYGDDGRGVQLPFNFTLVSVPWDAVSIATAIAEYEAALPDGGWPSWVLGNHDQPRIASRVGSRQARVAAMLLLTLRGTPTLYYGDELGLPDVPVPPERIVDVDGRDPQRSPMPWGPGPNAGFTTGMPWLPMAADARILSVGAQRSDDQSMLALHHRLLRLRRSETALREGTWTPCPAPDGTLVYDRTLGDARLRIVLNLTGEPVSIAMPGEWAVRLSTALDRDGELVIDELRARADEGLVLSPGAPAPTDA